MSDRPRTSFEIQEDLERARLRHEAFRDRPSAAAVPDPRFRDQLAEDLAQFIASYTRGERAWARMSDTARDIYRRGAKNFVVDALMPTITAEVEARVQAAANQRAVEVFDRVAHWSCSNAETRITAQNERDRLRAAPVPDKYPCYCLPGPARCDDPYNWCDRAAALASPAPAPQTGEGR